MHCLFGMYHSICCVCHWLSRCKSLTTKIELPPLLTLQLLSAWAQTWHIISTCRLQSSTQKRLGLDSGNLFRYQFSAIQNHHCPANASMLHDIRSGSACLWYKHYRYLQRRWVTFQQLHEYTKKLQGAQDLFFCILLRLLVKAAQQFN